MISSTKVDLGKVLEERKGFTVALFSTFNANLDFFEKYIIGCLKRGGCNHSILLMDSKMCSIALEESPHSKAGVNYLLQPIKQNGAFHPKLVLLLGPNSARLILGSHNLSMSGYRSNRELTTVLDFNINKEDDVELASYVFNKFRQWSQNTPTSNHLSLIPKGIPWLNPESKELPQNSLIQFSGPDENRSLFSACGVFEDELQHVVAGGAFFDKSLTWIQHLSSRCESLVVIVDPKTVQMGMPSKDLIPHFYKMELEGKVSQREISNGYLHAKWLYLRYKNNPSKLIIGSANQSKPGWMLSNKSSNCESVIILRGEKADGEITRLGLDGKDCVLLHENDWKMVREHENFESQTTSKTIVSGIWDGIDLILPLDIIGEVEIIESIGSDRAKRIKSEITLTDQKQYVIKGLRNKFEIWKNSTSIMYVLPSCFWIQQGDFVCGVIANQFDILDKKILSYYEYMVSEALNMFDISEAPSKPFGYLLKEISNFAKNSFAISESQVKESKSKRSKHQRQEMTVAFNSSDTHTKLCINEIGYSEPIKVILDLFNWNNSSKASSVNEQELFDETEYANTEDYIRDDLRRNPTISPKEKEKVEKLLLKKLNQLKNVWMGLTSDNAIGMRDNERFPINPGLQRWFLRFQSILLLLIYLYSEKEEREIDIDVTVYQKFLKLAASVVFENPIRKNAIHLKNQLGEYQYNSLLHALVSVVAISRVIFDRSQFYQNSQDDKERIASEHTLYFLYHHYLIPKVDKKSAIEFWRDMGLGSDFTLINLFNFYKIFKNTCSNIEPILPEELDLGDLLVPMDNQAPMLVFLSAENNGYKAASVEVGKPKFYKSNFLGIRAKELATRVYKESIK